MTEMVLRRVGDNYPLSWGQFECWMTEHPNCERFHIEIIGKENLFLYPVTRYVQQHLQDFLFRDERPAFRLVSKEVVA